MSPQYPFPHDLQVYVVADERFEVAYYSRGYQKFKRIREIGVQTWLDTAEQEIDHDHFWMVVACIQQRGMARYGVV